VITYKPKNRITTHKEKGKKPFQVNHIN